MVPLPSRPVFFRIFEPRTLFLSKPFASPACESPVAAPQLLAWSAVLTSFFLFPLDREVTLDVRLRVIAFSLLNLYLLLFMRFPYFRLSFLHGDNPSFPTACNASVSFSFLFFFLLVCLLSDSQVFPIERTRLLS